MRRNPSDMMVSLHKPSGEFTATSHSVLVESCTSRLHRSLRGPILEDLDFLSQLMMYMARISGEQYSAFKAVPYAKVFIDLEYASCPQPVDARRGRDTPP